MQSFDSRHGFAAAVLAAGVLTTGTAQAHFVLQAPAASLEQGPLGDPQKDGPCGDDGNGVPTDMISAYQAGDTISITINETIFHPGHYRIALAINDPSELPAPPEVTPGGGSDCGSAQVMNPPMFPVLADGVFLHDGAFAEPQTIDIQLPDDVSCDNCTLQVLEFMSDHGAPCFYYHCATISIEGGAAEASTTDPGESSGSSGGEESTGATSLTTTSPDAEESAGESSEEGTSSASATGNTSVTTAATTDTDSAGGDEDEGGCSCSTRTGGTQAGVLALLALVGVRRRRRADA